MGLITYNINMNKYEFIGVYSLYVVCKLEQEQVYSMKEREGGGMCVLS